MSKDTLALLPNEEKSSNNSDEYEPLIEVDFVDFVNPALDVEMNGAKNLSCVANCLGNQSALEVGEDRLRCDTNIGPAEFWGKTSSLTTFEEAVAALTKKGVKDLRSLIQLRRREQLAMILHARNCQINDKVNTGRAYVDMPPQFKPCVNELCQDVKQWLKHMEHCPSGGSSFAICTQIRWLLTHYTSCIDPMCDICEPNRKEQKELAAYIKTPVNLRLDCSDSIFNGYKGNPFPTVFYVDWRGQVPAALRDHFRAKLEQAMVPKESILAFDAVANVDAAILMEDESFKEATGLFEYYAFVVLKLDAVLKDIRGVFEHSYQWQPDVPIVTRHRYIIRIFTWIRSGVSDEKGLGGVLRSAQSIEEFDFNSATRMMVYFKRVSRHARFYREIALWGKLRGAKDEAETSSQN